MQNPINKSSIFTLAWSLYKAAIFTNFSDALKCAWLQTKNHAALKTGKATFTFVKSNGEKRTAIGTLNTDLFEYEHKGSDQKPNFKIQKYFDLEKQSWRCYKVSSLSSIAA